MNASNLLQAFGEATGLANLAFDADGSAFFETASEHLRVSLERDDQDSKLLAAVELGRLDLNSDAETASICGALLLVNSVFIALGRGSFALEGENSDRIMLMQVFEAASISREDFLGKMETLLADAREWALRIQGQDLGEVGEGATQAAASADMMRA